MKHLGLYLFTVFLSCNTPSQTQKYFIGESNNYIEFFNDSTYKADFGVSGYSDGKWRKEGDTFFLNSTYSPTTINKVEVYNSSSNASNQCAIFLKLSSGEPSNFSNLILYGNDRTDTLSFLGNYKPVNFIEKNIEYDSLKILQIKLRHDDYPYAMSKMYPFRVSDTIVVSYNYPSDIINYAFFENERIIIKRSK